MRGKVDAKKGKLIGIIALNAIVIIAIIAGLWFWLKQKPEPVSVKPDKSETVPEKVVESTGLPEKSKTVIDYSQIGKDSESGDIVQKRKAEYGIDKGLDMIVRSDESLKIGDETVPMQEILDKIRMEQGEFSEEDIQDNRYPGSAKTRENLVGKLEESEQRFLELEKLLSEPGIASDTETYEKYAQEHTDLGEIVADYKAYKNIVKKIEENKEVLKKEDTGGVQEQINKLRFQKHKLENELRIRVMPGENVDLYGIHVVQRGDNIWNIHLGFLKECFENRGVALKSSSDQPDTRGRSSGVGKILKFSEKMVYIYNLKKRNLDIDLNMIHPLSKIVIFNMEQVFALLNQIDYNNVNSVQFDGETLWIPAEQ
ncbi:MAG: PCRF domain-containing protein [Desulfobacteraceae bacterium]|nr:PCRF domain-containing protein [Desulfobacteraceae bacterium]